MTKQELMDATIIVLLSDGTFKLFEYGDFPQLNSTINQPDMQIKAQPAIATPISAQPTQSPSIFIQTEDELFINSPKKGIVNIKDWDAINGFDGALLGWANFSLKRSDLNPVDIQIIHDILAGHLPAK